MSATQRFGPPFQAGIFTVLPSLRRGKGIDNRAAVPFDTVLLDGKLRGALEDEARRLAAETNRAYGFYRSIHWVWQRAQVKAEVAKLGNFRPINWRIAQAYVVSIQDYKKRSVKGSKKKREEGTVYIEKNENLARNALIRVTRIRLER